MVQKSKSGGTVRPMRLAASSFIPVKDEPSVQAKSEVFERARERAAQIDPSALMQAMGDKYPPWIDALAGRDFEQLHRLVCSRLGSYDRNVLLTQLQGLLGSSYDQDKGARKPAAKTMALVLSFPGGVDALFPEDPPQLPEEIRAPIVRERRPLDEYPLFIDSPFDLLKVFTAGKLETREKIERLFEEKGLKTSTACTAASALLNGYVIGVTVKFTPEALWVAEKCGVSPEALFPKQYEEARQGKFARDTEYRAAHDIVVAARASAQEALRNQRTADRTRFQQERDAAAQAARESAQRQREEQAAAKAAQQAAEKAAAQAERERKAAERAREKQERDAAAQAERESAQRQREERAAAKAAEKAAESQARQVAAQAKRDQRAAENERVKRERAAALALKREEERQKREAEKAALREAKRAEAMATRERLRQAHAQGALQIVSRSRTATKAKSKPKNSLSLRSFTPTQRDLVGLTDSFERELIAALPTVRRAAQAMLGDPTKAEDYTMMTMEKALKGRHGYQLGTKMVSWLFMILRNNIASDMRRDWRTVLFDPQEFTPNASVPPAQQASAELSDLVEIILPQLPEDQRAFVLMAASGVSYEEMAQKANIPEGTVKSRVSRGRALMRMLADPGAETTNEADLIESFDDDKEAISLLGLDESDVGADEEDDPDAQENVSDGVLVSSTSIGVDDNASLFDPLKPYTDLDFGWFTLSVNNISRTSFIKSAMISFTQEETAVLLNLLRSVNGQEAGVVTSIANKLSAFNGDWRDVIGYGSEGFMLKGAHRAQTFIESDVSAATNSKLALN